MTKREDGADKKHSCDVFLVGIENLMVLFLSITQQYSQKNCRKFVNKLNARLMISLEIKIL